MSDFQHKISVIGHLSPDTDSICSAIAYANLKNSAGGAVYEARAAGAPNRETAFALHHFGVEAPRLCTTVSPQIKDIDIRPQPGIDGEMSLYDAWNLMRRDDIDTLCVTDENDMLQGLVTITDIANTNMEIFDMEVLSKAGTSYGNILSTLKGEMLLGDLSGTLTRGQIHAGLSPEDMDGSIRPGDLVLVTNRFETQLFAVEGGAGCIVICCGSGAHSSVMARAREKGCCIITTPYDTYAAARLINTAAPVRSMMLTKGILKFSVNDSIDDAKRVMASVRHRYFPVTDEQGRYCGVVSRRNLLNLRHKQIVLVDHNEKSQAVDGLEQAEILEIIDHHRIGSLETMSPVFFRNEPVGCTATIIYGMYLEQKAEISRPVAGLMLSAILSDTLMFRSPTCTDRDRAAAEALAEICGEDISAYGDKMFEAGADLSGRTAEEVFRQDFKVFSRGDARFGVGQGYYMTDNSRLSARELVAPYLSKAAQAEGLPLVLYMLTDMKRQSTDLIFFGWGAEKVINAAFSVEAKDGCALLPGVVSRKMQLVPPLMKALWELREAGQL